MGIFKDLTGQRFGKLTVIKRANDHIEPSGKRRVTWLCKCDCGNEKVILGHSLTTRHTRSCGCLNIKQVKELNKNRHKEFSIQIGGFRVSFKNPFYKEKKLLCKPDIVMNNEDIIEI